MNGTTHLTNVHASPHRETARGTVIGIETGKGRGTEIATGGSPLVGDMDLHHSGNGRGNGRGTAPRDGHTRRSEKRTSHQSRCLPSSPGLWAPCPSRRNLTVGVSVKNQCFPPFLSTLAPVTGPVFRTDDLLQVFRNAVIPNVNRPRSPTVQAPPRGMVSDPLCVEIALITRPCRSNSTTARLWAVSGT